MFKLNKYYNSYVTNLKYLNILINDEIKTTNKLKYDRLMELEVSATSLRRCMQDDYNVSESIFEALIKHFNIKRLCSDDIKILEDLFENIFFDFYYKNDLEKYLEILDEYISRNTIINPLLFEFKFLVKSSNYVGFSNEVKQEFSNVVKYKDCYADDFGELFQIIDTAFCEKIENRNFKNSKMPGVYYHILSSNMYKNNEFGLAVLYGYRAIEHLARDINYTRISSVYLTICACLNAIGNYEESNDIGNRLVFYFLHNDPSNPRYRGAKNHLAISYLGLHEDLKAIELINSIETKSIKEYLILMVVYYNKDNDKYSEIIKNNDERIKILNDYLITRKSIYLDKLKTLSINKGFINTLERRKEF
ncbi:MAG: hypothetical protein K6A63_00605 [Acholeplasmatales bacterium]|nr:hypothetical protein [Acholeplasmatales bacterium]